MTAAFHWPKWAFFLTVSGLAAQLWSADLMISEPRDVGSLLENLRAAHNVAAVACAVVRSNRLVAVGASGLRNAAEPEAPVTVQDQWHHGSLTKSMTATLAAMLVEEGRLRWDSTLAEVFPELAPDREANGIRSCGWLRTGSSASSQSAMRPHHRTPIPARGLPMPSPAG